MGKSRKVQLFGVSVLTPALAAYPQGAGARSLDLSPTEATEQNGADSNTPALGAAKGQLRHTLFSFSPSEKLAIAGDRIRLSQTNNPRQPKVLQSSYNTCCPYTSKIK